MAESVRVAPRQVGKFLAQTAIAFAAYVVAGKLGQATSSIRSSNLGPVWPAYGVALAAFLLYGNRVWVGIAAAAFLVAFLSPVSAVAAVGQATGATLAALIGAFLLYRIAKFRPSLSRLRDALALIVLGAFGSALVSASIGVSVLYATRVHAYSGLGSAWLIYWLGDSAGVLLVTPLVLTFPNLLRIRPQVRVAELAALLLLLTVSCFIVFGDVPFIPVKLHVLAFAVLPFVIWAAIRFGVSGATLATLIVATIATVETALGSGPFAQNTPFTNAVLLIVFFAVLSVSGMTLAAVIAEREQGEREREQLVRKQAAMEARLRSEEALRESEDKLRLILASTAEAIYGIDLEHRCTFCNPACLRILGYESLDEVLGKNMHDLIHRTRADGTPFPVEECRVHRVTRTGEGVHAEDELFWRANGTSLPVEYWSYPQRRGEEVVGAVVAFVDITECKLAEERLREYEKAIEGSEEMIAVVDREYRYLIANRKFLSQRNMTREQVVGRLVPEVLNKGFFEAIVKEKLDECFRGKVVRYEMRYTYPALGERDLLISNFPIEGPGGVDRVACILQDITERKRAEEALSDMNRRVIEAEERERNRIAWDLHEDIGQRLALLAIAVEQLKNDLPHQAVELLGRMDAVWKQTLEILTDVKASAHELYSPRLEYLGIAAVMRSFCEEFAQRKKVKIDFRSHGLPSLVLSDVSICLFRVLQEALHNGVKHSGVKKFEVQLWGASDGIHLTVRDSGAGFDTDAARKGRGLGLTRIEQRVKLVKGTFSIDSQPEKGTTVHVSVPLDSGSDSMRAAG
jgi:PAS domain S-box-containing protein